METDIKSKWNLDLNYTKTKKLLPVDVSIGMAETIPKQTKIVIWIDRCKKEFIISGLIKVAENVN